MSMFINCLIIIIIVWTISVSLNSKLTNRRPSKFQIILLADALNMITLDVPSSILQWRGLPGIYSQDYAFRGF